MSFGKASQARAAFRHRANEISNYEFEVMCFDISKRLDSNAAEEAKAFKEVTSRSIIKPHHKKDMQSIMST